MSRIKALTVAELIDHLKTLDQTLQVVVLREGKGHYYPVIVKEMTVEPEGVYYPSDSYGNGDKPSLVIAVV